MCARVVLQMCTCCVTGVCVLYYRYVHVVLQVCTCCVTGVCVLCYRCVHVVLQVLLLGILGVTHRGDYLTKWKVYIELLLSILSTLKQNR